MHAILIDDDPKDLAYAERLSRGSFSCTAERPRADVPVMVDFIEQKVNEGTCDLLLLDYRLDSVPDPLQSAPVRYRGGQLAAAVRERIPSLPLVLLTTERFFQASIAIAPRLRELYDSVVLKGDLAKRTRRASVALELEDLASGCNMIRSSGASNAEDLARLLGGSAEDVILACRDVESYVPDAIARWILDELLQHKGLLVRDEEAAAILGIAQSSFNRVELRRAIESCEYRGPFAPSHRRWWRARLAIWLRSVVQRNDAHGKMTRAAAIAKEVELSGHVIRSARCIWCKSTDVSHSCSICAEPTCSLHRLAMEDNIPHWAIRSNACYRCIQAGSAESAAFQPGTEEIVRALKAGGLTPRT